MKPLTKVRASCDACHFAKVKCEKLGPSCLRCLKLQGQCSYSPALPRTYQRRGEKRPVDLKGSGTNRSHGADGSQAKHSRRPSQSLNSASMDHGIQDQYTMSETPRIDDLNQHNDQAISSYAMESDWQNFHTLSDDLSWLTELECHNIDLQALQRTNTGTDSSSVALMEDHCNTDVTPFATPDALTSASSTLVTNDTNIEVPSNRLDYQSSLGGEHKGSCDCLSDLLGASQIVDRHDTSMRLALDCILCMNRAAVEKCLAGLGCACHEGRNRKAAPNKIKCVTSCQLMAGGLFDRMIMLYQKAIHDYCGATESEWNTPTTPSHSEKKAEPLGTRSYGPQLRLGEFAIEKSDQVAYTKRIVAMEIDKLRRIVTDLDTTMQDDSRVIGTLQQYLLRRCDDAVKEITF